MSPKASMEVSFSNLINSINVSSLRSCLYEDKQSLPAYPGIYFIGFASDDLWYIGKSENIQNRHKGASHHRHNQFKAAEVLYRQTLQIWYWQVPNDWKSRLKTIEDALIKRFNPKQNDTPDEKIRRNQGTPEPVYVQLESIRSLEEPFESEEDSYPGIYASRKKLHYLKRAFKRNSQCILISSISTSQASNPAFNSYKQLLPLNEQWKMQTSLYFLEYVFRPAYTDEIEYEDSTQYYIYAEKEDSLIRRIYLNDFDGFSDFRKRYLVMGLINCAAHPFTAELLKLAKK